MKVGTIIAPKKGSWHHKQYGDFVGEVQEYSGYSIKWSLLEEGNGALRKQFGNYFLTTSGTEDLEDIAEIYNSPLWKALG